MDKLKILAIETATDACSVALRVGQEVRAFHVVQPRKHAELILPAIRSLLDEADLALGALDCLAFGRGPGGFTGLRIAAGVIQGLALGVDLPVAPVSTLAAIAQGAYREKQATNILAAIDARMDEVYWGLYVVEDGLVGLAGREHVSAPESVTVAQDLSSRRLAGSGQVSLLGAGTGSRYQERMTGVAVTQWDAQRLPHAQDIAVLAEPIFEAGHAVSAEHAQPVYLRDNVARKKAARKKGQK